jgi:hypothetical protein
MPGGERGISENGASLATVTAGLFYIGDDPDRRRDGARGDRRRPGIGMPAALT